jgi:RNA polymerase sigma-70 factor (ECF subfamily)
VAVDPRLRHAADGALVERVLAGDRSAFGTLVERYQDKMLAYARYMGFDDADARDAVQDAFVRAFRHLRRCGDPNRFGGWLFKIVSNVCRTAGGNASRRRTDSLDAHGDSLVASGPPPDEELESSWLKSQVRRALDSVAPDQREALVLMYLHGHSVREIQEMTGASTSAVKMRLKRGREALEALLGPLLIEVPEP